MQTNLKICLAFGLVVFACGWGCGFMYRTVDPPLMDVVQVQEYLNAHGYDLVVDGKVGVKTQAAWDELTGNRMAKDIFKEAGEYYERD